MNELLNRLKNASIGCYIGNMFLGRFEYADDLCLSAPSRGSISLMLLGHTISNNNINNIAVCKATRDMVRRTNYVLSKFVSVIQIYDHSFFAPTALVFMAPPYGD